MPVPKRKRSRSRRDKRFANKGIKARGFGTCKNCSEPIAPHAICKNCGYYHGRKVITTKNERATKRADERKLRASKQDPQQAVAEPIESEPQES